MAGGKFVDLHCYKGNGSYGVDQICQKLNRIFPMGQIGHYYGIRGVLQMFIVTTFTLLLDTYLIFGYFSSYVLCCITSTFVLSSTGLI